MAISVFNPDEIEVGPIGTMMAGLVKNEEVKAFLASKGEEDGNLSAVVVSDSENMGVGVGTWKKGQHTNKPVPLMFDEVLVIVSGTITITIDGESKTARQGEIVHLHAKQMVMFGSEEGCRLVWITCPPTWKAIERAWEQGLIPKPAK